MRDAAMEELLVECIDALRVPARDPQDRAEHIRLLRHYTRRRTVPKELRSLLERIEQELSVRHSLASAVWDDESHSRRITLVAELLESEHVDLPRFAYHGTIHGRLASISKQGLKPAFQPVWKEAKLATRCADAVFLADTWRGAAQWAEFAHLRSRGRRDGIHRTPVILRIPAAGLALEADRVASAPGNFLVRGRVSAESADVFVGPQLSGYPSWQPLAEALTASGSSRG